MLDDEDAEGEAEFVIEAADDALELAEEVLVADEEEELEELVAGALNVVTARFVGDSSKASQTTVFPMTDGSKKK